LKATVFYRQLFLTQNFGGKYEGLFLGITFVVVIVIAPLTALCWLIHRLIKGGGGGRNNSITGD
jgi:hypothetical protein